MNQIVFYIVILRGKIKKDIQLKIVTQFDMQDLDNNSKFYVKKSVQTYQNKTTKNKIKSIVNKTEYKYIHYTKHSKIGIIFYNVHSNTQSS